MTVSYLKYKLIDGYVQNWLTVGPEVKVVEDIVDHPLDPDQKIALLQKNNQTDYEIAQVPVEPGPIGDGIFNTDTFQGTWSYTKCKEDHLVVVPVFAAKTSHLRSWAYVELKAKKARKVILNVFTYNTINIWLNEQFLERKEVQSNRKITRFLIEATLSIGNNGILIRCEDIGIGNLALAFAIKVVFEDGSPVSDILVALPTTIPHPGRRTELEKAFEEAYVDRDIFSAAEKIIVKWPKNIRNKAIYQIRLQTPANRIFAQSEDRGRVSETAYLGHSASLREGPYNILLMPVGREYYEEHIRITRKFNIWVAGNYPFSERPYGTFQERKYEALQVASLREGALFAEIANMALGKWASVDLQSIKKEVSVITSNPSFHQKELLGLIGAFLRYKKNQNDITTYLDNWLHNLSFNIAEHSLDEPDDSDKIIRLAIRLLISAVQTNNQVQQQSEGEIVDWLTTQGQYGFECGNSPQTIADVLFTLSYLVDLAESEKVYDLAGILMDKLLLILAINSYKGVYGGGYGHASEMDVRGGITQPTAGICRLYWGMGAYNHQLAYYVSLACMQNYEMPTIISDIAASQGEFWGTEMQRSMLKATYRTSDYMLSSVMELEAGERGRREHVWQATLGSEAIVYTNAPVAKSDLSSNLPGFWCGNSRLPKVVQWKDVLIAIYNMPPDDYMGYTHAHFPIYAFDEYKAKRNWFFARKGEAYLAITASNPIQLVKTGESAFRELRCPGNQVIWICQLGRVEQDGDFIDFRQRVLDLSLEFSGLEIKFTTLRIEQLVFGWNTTFHLNNNDVQYSRAHHIHYPFASGAYPMKSLEVLYNEYLLKLNFDLEP